MFNLNIQYTEFICNDMFQLHFIYLYPNLVLQFFEYIRNSS